MLTVLKAFKESFDYCLAPLEAPSQMLPALQPIKKALDPHMLLLDAPSRAYRFGQEIYISTLWFRDDSYIKSRKDLLSRCKLFTLFTDTVHTLKLIAEADRLKIFKERQTEALFFYSMLGLASLNGLAFVSKYFGEPLPSQACRFLRASWEKTPIIRSITILVFAIFELHRQPQKIVLCLLGAYSYNLLSDSSTSEDVRSLIEKIQDCVYAIRFYIGSKYERASIITFYASHFFSK